MGWLSPTTIKPKIIMQELWKLKSEWDALLPEDLYNRWVSHCKDLDVLKRFKIDRCISAPHFTSHDSPCEYELHGFSDASQLAYSACVYLRTISNGQSAVKLVAAKTKVAPIKPETIPRLELCGAKLLSKLIQTITSSLKLDFRSIRCWTDNTGVLG